MSSKKVKKKVSEYLMIFQALIASAIWDIFLEDEYHGWLEQ